MPPIRGRAHYFPKPRAARRLPWAVAPSELNLAPFGSACISLHIPEKSRALSGIFSPSDGSNPVSWGPVFIGLMENPMTALKGLRGLVVVDEAPRASRLFPVLRVLQRLRIRHPDVPSRQEGQRQIQTRRRPTLTRSMQAALTDLELDELWIVYPGQRNRPLGNKISVCPLAECVAPGGRAQKPDGF